MSRLTRVLGAGAIIGLLATTLHPGGQLASDRASVIDAGGTPSNSALAFSGPAILPDGGIATDYDARLGYVRNAQHAAASASFVGPPRQGNTAPRTIAPAKSTEEPRDKMSGPVALLAATGGPQPVDIVVRYSEFPQLFDDEFVEQLGGEVTRAYQTLDMRAIRIPADALESLAADDNVDWLSLDDAVSFTSVSSREAANLPGPTSVHAGWSGSNVGVAVLDTGVALHADLDANIVQYSFLNGAYPTPTIVNGVVTARNDDPRIDLFGHGTHVAGIVTGSGVESGNQYTGTAKGATLLSLQVLDASGGGSMSDVMAALDWLSVYGSYFDIRVVNLSLGMGISESNTTDPLVLAVESLWDAGMVVVVAAGNDGNAGSMTITSPGNSRKVITVGSLTDNGTGSDFSDDYVSSYSSMGPTIGDYVLKPDLVAPGNRIVAAIGQGTTLASALPGRLIGCNLILCTSQYLELSGTSMATPIVTGAAALMLQKDPTLSPATVKARLMRSARNISADAAAAGAGLIDIDAALGETGVMTGEALSPVMVPDPATNGVLVEDTAMLWGDEQWGAGYIFSDGATWATGYGWTDGNGVTANGYAWTDENVWAKGYGWTDETVNAKGYGWTDGVNAKSLLEDSGAGMLLNDDAPSP